MIESLGYLISSHIGYEAPRERLLASMRDLPITNVVIGGYNLRSGYYRSGVAHISADHNSYDYTALIDFVEHPADYPDWSHVFLLHDTMELGPNADRLIRAVDPQWPAVAVWGGQCNLGLYRADYVRQCLPQLLGLKNCSKAYAVEMEGFLWTQLPKDERGVYGGTIEVSEEYPVYGGAPRRREYYTAVDVTKYKANWGQPTPPGGVVTP